MCCHYQAIVKALLSPQNGLNVATVIAIDIVTPRSPIADERVVFSAACIFKILSMHSLQWENILQQLKYWLCVVRLISSMLITGCRYM